MKEAKYYDTGKVKIGLLYQRDTRPQLGRFEETLQEALLAKDHSPFNAFIQNHPIVSTIVLFVGIAATSIIFSL